MGHLPTHDYWPLIFKDEGGGGYQVYDIYRMVGYFFDVVYDDTSLHVDNGEKVSIDDPKQAPDIPPPAMYLTHDDINKMKLLELKI